MAPFKKPLTGRMGRRFSKIGGAFLFNLFWVCSEAALFLESVNGFLGSAVDLHQVRPKPSLYTYSSYRFGVRFRFKLLQRFNAHDFQRE